jgi:hypothetical protein
MHHRKLAFWLITSGLLFLITTGLFFLLPAQLASAQCGSQASSCKNCHETQAQDPVNNDGTAWHTQHAFGDFCYLCHGGNNQATDKAAAHTAMVDPLKDIVSACKSCHANDYQAKAQIYATTLGVTISSGTSATATPTSQPAASSPAQATVVPVAAQAAAIPAANMVDYTQRYNESVLGKKPVNVGNVILILMIAAMVLGGGFFIARREGLFKVSFQETRQIQGSYPADVVDMVPSLAKLKPAARKDLNLLLSRPDNATEAFALFAKIMKGNAAPDHEHKDDLEKGQDEK